MLAIDTGCPPPELLVTVSITSGIFAAPSAAISASERGHVHVAFEIQPRLRVARFRNGQVDGARAGEFDIGAGGVEVRVGRHDVARLAHHGEQDALGGAPLVGGHHVAESGELVGHPLEAEEALAAGVGFVAAHHRRPLLGGHRAGAGIGQQVDQDVARFDQEEVVAGRFQIALAFRRRGVAQRLHALDAERFDDGAHEQIIAPGAGASPSGLLQEAAKSRTRKLKACATESGLTLGSSSFP